MVFGLARVRINGVRGYFVFCCGLDRTEVHDCGARVARMRGEGGREWMAVLGPRRSVTI